ncbi:MAG: hypothetical protein J5871_06465, partial [Bacteroidales bacterium]|nr:hypothetical protein [Bacteroidales bacterium]
GNAGETLAGRIKLVFAGGVPVVQEVSEAETLLILSAPDGGTFETGKWYYLEALPGTLSQGYTMTFYKENEHAELSSSGPVTFRRGIFGSLSAIDEGLSWTHETPDGVAVDMGLSVKWASCNVGASAPEDYGVYFAWGETAPKSTYDWSTYKYSCNYYLYKYCPHSSHGYMGYSDTRTILDLSDDAARMNWGGSWRMPTEAEWRELMNTDNCTWTWMPQNGVNGRKVTSKKTGNSIFLPAAGLRYDSSLYNAGSSGYFWSSSLGDRGDPYWAYRVFFDSSSLNWAYWIRCHGMSVRAVTE